MLFKHAIFRYLKPVIEETKYDEINEREIYGTPRSDKGKDSMNKLSDSRTTSSASSVRNMWNIKSGDDDGCVSRMIYDKWQISTCNLMHVA